MRLAGTALAGVFLIAWLALAASPASASGDLAGWHHGAPFAYEEGLLNYLEFPRATLHEKGIDVHLSTLGIWQSIVAGGTARRSKFSGSYDLQVYLNSSKPGLWEGGYALLRAEGKTNDFGINPFTGAVIPVNFDAAVPEPEGNPFEFTEWWIAQEFAQGKVEVLAGMWDIGRFFDGSPFSGPYQFRFLNSHMFFNSVLLPFAPYNILGGIVKVKPIDRLTIRTAIGDPNSSAVEIDWFGEGDINLLHEWQLMARPFGKPGLFTAGFAYTNQEQATIAQDPTSATTDTKSSDWAVYLNFSQWLYQNPSNPHQAIGVFGRIGITNGDINLIENHFSMGVTFDGMIPSRPKDVVGVVGWYNRFSGDLSSSLDDSSAGFEAYYRCQVVSWLQVSADVQYLIEPGIAEDSDDTVVLGLRALVLF